MSSVPRRTLLVIACVAAALAAAVILRWHVGESAATSAPSADPAIADTIQRQIDQLKALRIAMAAVVGAALAVAGVMLQCLLRNPLASPDLMGLGSGAGLGVTIAAYFAFLAGGLASQVSGGASSFAALIGASAALAIVYALSQRRGILDPVSLVLVGVVVSIMCSAGIVFFEHLLPDRGRAVSRWLLGALNDDASTSSIILVAAVTFAGIVVGLILGPWMDAAAMSEDEARSVGVRLGMLRAVLFAFAGLLTAAAVTLAGPVGFVGLVCPHVIRLAAGPKHRGLIIGSALAGATLVVAADALVKGINLGAGRLPIGVLTSIIGGPILIAMIRGPHRTSLV
jgi:iron complex transport system permease protein